jgi:hypothetical protein
VALLVLGEAAKREVLPERMHELPLEALKSDPTWLLIASVVIESGSASRKRRSTALAISASASALSADPLWI